VRKVLLLTFLLVASPAQAASLMLGCSGTETITQIRGYEVASDPERENPFWTNWLRSISINELSRDFG
jgi:hypothetical protein